MTRAAAPRQGTAPTQAFTLIELLLAMAVSTTVLLALWSLLNIYTTLFNTAGVETEQAQIARAMLDLIEADLTAVVSVPPGNNVPESTNLPLDRQLDGTDASSSRSAEFPNDDSTSSRPISSSSRQPARGGASSGAVPGVGNGFRSGNSIDSSDLSATGNDVSVDQTLPAHDELSVSSHLAGDDTSRVWFHQPVLLGTSDTLWMVIHRYPGMADAPGQPALRAGDDDFRPPTDLAIVEYKLLTRDGTDVVDTTFDSPPSPTSGLTMLGRDESLTSSPDASSSPGGLDSWQQYTDTESNSAAAQLGLIDREWIDASLGVERRESAWPVSAYFSRTPTPAAPAGSAEASSDDDSEQFVRQREFQPPHSWSDIDGTSSSTSATSARDRGAANDIAFASLITPEVTLIRFRYHDGVKWRDHWDSGAQGRLPRAVEIILAVLPTDRAAIDDELERFESDTEGENAPWPVYRHVVALPTVAPRSPQVTVTTPAEAEVSTNRQNVGTSNGFGEAAP